MSALSTSDNGFIEYSRRNSNSVLRDPIMMPNNSTSDVNEMLPEGVRGGVASGSMNVSMETKLWHIGSSMDTLERIEEEGPGADKTGSKVEVKHVKPVGSLESSQVIELSNENINEVDGGGSAGSRTGSESELDKFSPPSSHQPSPATGYGNMVRRSFTGVDTPPKKRSRLNGLKKPFKLK